MDLDLWYRYLLLAGQERVLLSDSLLTYFRLHEASKTVALSPRFKVDIDKVLHNIFFSFGLPPELLDFMRASIGDEQFVPARYNANISVEELSPLIRTFAWYAVQYYNRTHNRAGVRASLALARQHGHPLNGAMLRQLIKHCILPQGILR